MVILALQQHKGNKTQKLKKVNRTIYKVASEDHTATIEPRVRLSRFTKKKIVPSIDLFRLYISHFGGVICDVRKC